MSLQAFGILTLVLFFLLSLLAVYILFKYGSSPI